MTCPSCATQNPDGARFCMSCGAALATACRNCGADLPEGAAFCMQCGTKVAVEEPPLEPGPDAPSTSVPGVEDRMRRYIPDGLFRQLQVAQQGGAMLGERRTVTMLFCDVQGSTAAAAQLDPEEWADIMNGAFEHLIAPVYRYEGTLARLMGDAILAFFGAPIAHEDDPERAVLAGLEILDEIQPYRERVRRDWGIDFNVRVGINTGLVVVGAIGSDLRVEYTAMGDAVNIAARMEQTAEPGTVQISDRTHQLVAKLFEFENLGGIDVKGRDEPVQSYRVSSAIERPSTTRGIEGLHAPMIGRAREMDQLGHALDDVCGGGGGRVVSVVGEAGLGKSRLVAELYEQLERDGRLGDFTWAEGRSLSYEVASPYAPVRRVVRRLAGLSSRAAGPDAWGALTDLVADAAPGRVAAIAPFLGSLLDIELPPDATERVGYLQPGQLRAEIFRSLLELFEALAARRPLVLVFEDLHWGDSASIDVVKELLAQTDRLSLLLILIFRPRRTEPSWDVHELAAREHSHAYTEIVLHPLEQSETRTLVSSLLDVDGLPDSVRELILAKAEGNPFFVEEVIRSMIDQDLVVHEDGRWVATADVDRVAIPDTLAAVITTRLDRLGERAKLTAHAASVLGRQFRYDELAAVLDQVAGLDDAVVELQRRDLIREVSRVPTRVFRFKHALVQETVYETVLLKRRIELHAAVADYLVGVQPERAEAIADHYLASRQPVEALPHLVEAGERALRAFALPEATARLSRSLELLEEHPDPGLLRTTLERLGQAKEASFDFEAGVALYQRMIDIGVATGDQPMEISGRNKLAFVTGLMFNDRDIALDALARSEEAARAIEDGPGLAEACMFQCAIQTQAAQFDDVEYYMAELARLGEEMASEDTLLFGMAHLANTAVYTLQADKALDQGLAALERAESFGNLKFQAELLSFPIPWAHLMKGDRAAAAESVERGMEIALRIGDRVSEALAAVTQGNLAAMHGQLETALLHYRRTLAASEATGMPFFIALGNCVTGTCYQHIGMADQTRQLHGETLAIMEMPMGRMLGGWLWAEIGHCALAAGDVGAAKDLFEKALTEVTTPMYVSRPDALRGVCLVAMEEGRLDDAQASFDQYESYVRDHQMRDHEEEVEFTRGRLAAALGDHEAALIALDRAAARAAAEQLLLMEMYIALERIGVLEDAGRRETLPSARERAGELASQVAANFTDEDLRLAFETRIRGRLAQVGI